MLLAGADSLRDVIAFPKTGGGYDPLTAAPAPITPEQRKEAGVDARRPPRGRAADGPGERAPRALESHGRRPEALRDRTRPNGVAAGIGGSRAAAAAG